MQTFIVLLVPLMTYLHFYVLVLLVAKYFCLLLLCLVQILTCIISATEQTRQYITQHKCIIHNVDPSSWNGSPEHHQKISDVSHQYPPLIWCFRVFYNIYQSAGTFFGLQRTKPIQHKGKKQIHLISVRIFDIFSNPIPNIPL